MPDVLTQSQIDALLGNLMSGDGDAADVETKDESASSEKKAKSYDFKTPKKFTREKLKTIDSIFENYSRLLSSYLTGLMRLYCKVELLQIEEQRYYEYNNALPDYVMMALVNLGVENQDVSETGIIFQLSNPVSYTMIDRLLGGHGNYTDLNRDFTEIEINLMRGILNNMVGLFQEAWASYLDIKPVLTTLETNARVVQTIGPEEVVILVMMEVEIRNMKNTISVCIPALNLEEMMSCFSDRYAMRSGKRFDADKEQERREEILRGIKGTELSVSAVLGDTQLDLSDVLTLQVNDVIPLSTRVDDNIQIRVGSNLWFDGKLGVKNGKKAVRIDNIYKN